MTKTVLLFLCLLLLSAPRTFAASEKDNYPYMNISPQASGNSLDQPRASAKKKKKKSKSKKKVAAWESTSKKAQEELQLAPGDMTKNVIATPATVSSSIEAVQNPIKEPSFEISASVESYQPAGRIKLPGFDAYDLNKVSAAPMVAVDFRWMPIKLDLHYPTTAGPYASLAYAQQEMSLITPSGVRIENSKIQATSGELGLAASARLSDLSKWAAHVQFGLGQFNSVQTSATSYANRSAQESFLSAGIFGDYRILDRVSVFIGYDYRAPLRGEPDEIILQRSNFLAGLTGGFN
jgi:hypothetical protein